VSSVAIAVFTRDLRVRDNPALAEAAAADMVLPVFVLDEVILRSAYNRPNRARFLSESLLDLDSALRERGGRLVVRRGRWAQEIAALAEQSGADAVHVAGDVTGYARSRLAQLRGRLPGDVRLEVHDDALLVVPPGAVGAAGKGHMAVFTPYLRRWEQRPLREAAPTPRRLVVPPVPAGTLPAPSDISRGEPSPVLPRGGETEGRRRLAVWLRNGITAYSDDHDALGRDSTSRLSPYLHLGCLSPVELVRRARERGGAGSDAFVRQVAWRDFHHQVLAARPAATREDYRPRGDRWHRSAEELAAWKEGRTGYPVVDAGMRQLAREGWMHNRARLITANFLTKTLYLDWRLGAQHFVDLLVDADVANNTMNWQWVAGTGTDSRVNRTYNVVLQARRHDPRGAYVRRYVQELAGLDDAYVHEPWLLPEDDFAALGYPLPIVDPTEANDRLRHGRGRG
jgi:deoxyribodipyrimidine photo-lyase